MFRHTVLDWVLFFWRGNWLDLENMITLFFSGFSLTLHLEGPVAKVLLQNKQRRRPIVQYPPRIGIVSFVCGAVLEGH